MSAKIVVQIHDGQPQEFLTMRPPLYDTRADHEAENFGQTAKAQLKSFVDRIERLEAEKRALADDIKDLYAEAKSTGFDTKALRTIIRLRKQDSTERADQEMLIATYMSALGMLKEDA